MTADERYDAIIATMGKKFRQEREKRAWSQPDLAARVGKTPSALSQIEKGKIRGVSLMTIFRLIEALEIDPTSFFGDVALYMRWMQKRNEMREDPRLARTMSVLDTMFHKITGIPDETVPSEGEEKK